ncbi:MAG: hypothetical protein UR22_C0009G0041 [Parcubacteria group bacterium GW2011_GWC2_32_10]|nr:MAG: hypothetical protein UR22_C0009G0041 [Parcubacteria group bacterium GW2011_GWC2_32_10]
MHLFDLFVIDLLQKSRDFRKRNFCFCQVTPKRKCYHKAFALTRKLHFRILQIDKRHRGGVLPDDLGREAIPEATGINSEIRNMSRRQQFRKRNAQKLLITDVIDQDQLGSYIFNIINHDTKSDMKTIRIDRRYAAQNQSLNHLNWIKFSNNIHE